MTHLFLANTFSRLVFFAAIAVSLCVVALPSLAQNNESPVDLQADNLVHDESGQKVTASGDVILKQEGRTVQADRIVYYLKEDRVVATGHVEFTDVNGDKHLAQKAEFNNALKDGFVNGLKTMLVDGSRFKASTGQHIKGNRTVMKDAFYTPCETCQEHPEEEPLWQIRASEVEHDKEKKTVSYHNARFEMKGVPVAYLPYFAHPDGSVKRKSGFLPPSAGYNSELGGFVQSHYYWSIAPEKDVTVGLMAMTQEAPLATAQWRQRWENASLVTDGSVTYSERIDSIAGQAVNQDSDVRGHIEVDGRWDINNMWRSGVNLHVASDDQYLRQYDFESEDVLENELYVERFSGRDYAAARILAFQDLRIDEQQQDQPHVLPEIQATFLGEPDSVPVVGGRWSVDTSFLGIVRDDNEQDVNRAHAALGWSKRVISDFGLVSKLDANVQGSAYNVNDRTGTQGNPLVDDSSSETRGFGYVSGTTSYPVAKAYENSQVVIEPIASLTVAPNIGIDNKIPNEDSQDVQIDALNIFEANRFPGVDGVEDQSHVTYGARTGVYGNKGSYGEVFLGQSYRFNEDDNPFGEGSGLNEQESDVVGQVSGSYKGDYVLDYRFQLDNDSLASQRHEVDAYAKLGDLTLSSQYLFAKALAGTDIDETREQVRNAASYYINDGWRIFGAARHDLGDNPGLRTANLGVDYTGQCVSLSVIGERTLTDDASGDSGTEIVFRIGLKNLGEFETSGVQIGGNRE